MRDLKLSFRKLGALQRECFENALKLHFDSILLVKARSYASAFAISVIASEEFGKGFGIEEISYQARFQKGFDASDQKILKALLSDHKLKQGWFVSSLIGHFGTKSILKQYQTIQVAKNDAIYVGIRKGNHQIIRPFLVSPPKAKRQIRIVNDALVDLVEGILKGKYSYEEVADSFFKRRTLLNKLVGFERTLR